MLPSAESHTADLNNSSDRPAAFSLAGFEAVLIVIVIAGLATSAGVFCLGFVPDLLP